MVQLFIDGGGFMWPILFIFIIGFVFVGERLYHLIKGLSANEQFAMDVVYNLFHVFLIEPNHQLS